MVEALEPVTDVGTEKEAVLTEKLVPDAGDSGQPVVWLKARDVQATMQPSKGR